MIHYTCPMCSGALSNSEAAAGMTISCQHCSSPVEVPSSSNAAPTSSMGYSSPAGSPTQPIEASDPIIDTIGGWFGAHNTDGPPEVWNMGKRILFGLLGLFLFVLFGSLFVWVAYSYSQVRASQSWPSVTGKIERAGVSESKTRTSRGRTRVEYSAYVSYLYSVDGKEYNNADIGFGPDQNYSFMAKQDAKPYEDKKEVTVYYDPSNPETSVLERRLMFGGYVMGFVGLFAGFIGLRLLLTAFAPLTASSNSRWMPWSRRFTWPDLPLTALGILGIVFWVPMLFGL